VKVGTGINLLHGAVIWDGFASGWQDSDANDLADGYTANATPVSFTSDVQTINSSGFVGMNKIFNYPLSSISLALSATAVSFHPEDGRISMTIKIQDFNDTVLSDSGESTGTVGRFSRITSTPAGSYAVNNVVLRPNGPGSSGDIAASFPALRTDGSDEYIAG